MSKVAVLSFVLSAGWAIDVQAIAAMPSVRATPVAWRGGFRGRNYSYSGSGGGVYRGSRGYRGSSGKSSPLDYPPSSQPTVSRMHQWNKYPNQPYYLRGERKSLLILP